MKKYMKFLSVFLFMSFLLATSCNNDDDVPPPEDDINAQDPDDIDPDDPADDTPVETPDYLALKTFYEANPTNTLGWDMDDLSMKTWMGVSLNNDRVTELRLNLRNVSILVPEIGQLSELTGLFVSDNSIEEVPTAVGDLGKLLYLSLNNNSLPELPREIGKLTNLEELEFTGNPLIVVAQEICDLGVTGTNIQKDELSMVCEGTLNDHQALKALYEANLNTTVNWGNNIDDVYMTGWDGVTISFLNERVTEVDLALKGIDVVVAEIEDLESLEYLNLGINFGLTLPSTIGNLSNLTELYLTGNSLNELPSEIGELAKLEKLVLDSNELQELPESIINLTNLEVLFLYNNEFSTLPKEFATLQNLNELNLERNPLTELPPEICDMLTTGVVKLDQDLIDDGICQ